MSVFNPNIPQPSDFLSQSQNQLLQNFNKSDSSFGVDHYAFSDPTPNNGKHNQVTTPAYVTNPPTGLPPVTIAAEPKFYAYEEPISNVGVIQYSRGPLNAVPTPLTSLQSPSTPLIIAAGNTTDVLDFTNLSRAFCVLYSADMVNAPSAKIASFIIWNGTVLFEFPMLTSASTLLTQISGKILQIKNNAAFPMNDVYWTLDLQRLS